MEKFMTALFLAFWTALVIFVIYATFRLFPLIVAILEALPAG